MQYFLITFDDGHNLASKNLEIVETSMYHRILEEIEMDNNNSTKLRNSEDDCIIHHLQSTIVRYT